jgi:hypothetical protein
VADATTFRLDTADIAIEAGWRLESLSRIDEFSKDGVTVMVQYASDDEIDSLTRSREGCGDEVYGSDSSGKAERLRIWLGVRAVSNPIPMPGGDNNNGAPITVERLRAQGLSRAAYVKNGDDLQMLDIISNSAAAAVATARDYIRSYDGRPRVMWHRDGWASPRGNDQEMWWAEMPLLDGRVVGWFRINQNFHGP